MNVDWNKQRYIRTLMMLKVIPWRLLDWLEKSSFYLDPASTHFHGSFPGGLCEHSLNVYTEFYIQKPIYPHLSHDDVILASLLHDVCKVGAYISHGGPYLWNPTHPKGHGALSLSILEPLVDLTDLQKNLIRYHMGIYYTKEFSLKQHEYSLADLLEIYRKRPECKLFYFCDELASMKEKCGVDL